MLAAKISPFLALERYFLFVSKVYCTVYIQLSTSNGNRTEAVLVQCTDTNQNTNSVSILSLLFIWFEAKFFGRVRNIGIKECGMEQLV